MMPEMNTDHNYHWYEYLYNFFNVEPFSLITEINKIHKLRKAGKRLSRVCRRKLRGNREKLKMYLQRWSSDKMSDFRSYISTILESVFSSFHDQEMFESLAKEHNDYYKERSFFIVYDMLKKYLRSVSNNELYQGAIDKNIVRVISGVSDYVPAVNISSSDDTTQSRTSIINPSFYKLSQVSLRKSYRQGGRSASQISSRLSVRSRTAFEGLDPEDLDERIQVAIDVITAAIHIHKSYIQALSEKKVRTGKAKTAKLDQFNRLMKKKVFAIAKGSKFRIDHTEKKWDHLEGNNFNYNYKKKMVEIKSKKIVVKKLANEACKNLVHRPSSKRKGEKMHEITEKHFKKDRESNYRSTRKLEMWESCRKLALSARQVEKTEGDRILAFFQKLEMKKKTEFLNQCSEDFKEFFVFPEVKKTEEEREESVTFENGWFIHKPSKKIYYDRESALEPSKEEEKENLIQLCKSISDTSCVDAPTNESGATSQADDEGSQVSGSESIYTDEFYLDDISECFREIGEGAKVPSSSELSKSCDGSDQEATSHDLQDKCIDDQLDGLKEYKRFFKTIKIKSPEKLRSYNKEDELSITSELMQQLCETSGSETSDTTYHFQPPNEKFYKDKPDILEQPVTFRDFNHRKLQLHMMEKQCKASDLSSVSEYNVWNKAIFKLKQREKYYYKKMGVSESYERLKRDLKHLINKMKPVRHKRQVLFDQESNETDLQVNENLFKKINIDENKIFPTIDKVQIQQNKVIIKEAKSESSDHIFSTCLSGSCFKDSTPSELSREESLDIIDHTDKELKRLCSKKPYVRDKKAYEEYTDVVYRGYPHLHILPKAFLSREGRNSDRPKSAPSDARTQVGQLTVTALSLITKNASVEDIATSISPTEDPAAALTKLDGASAPNRYKTRTPPEKKSGSIWDIPYTTSAAELDGLLRKLHPDLKETNESYIRPAESELSTHMKKKQDLYDIIDVQSLLSRDEHAIEDDYYSLKRKRNVLDDRDVDHTDIYHEYRVKIYTPRYVTNKSEKKWPKHYFPDFLHLYQPLLDRRIPVSLANIRLRTTIPSLKPDNELFELPQFAVVSHLYPPITYESSEKIESRILWDRPEKFELDYSELGDKPYIIKSSSGLGYDSPMNFGGVPYKSVPEQHHAERDAKSSDFQQTKDINWLTWNAPEYNFSLSNKMLRRILLDLGSTPDVYDKLQILLKNRKLGYVPMKELLSSNQEKLFNYISSIFLNKIAVKYPKRFIRLIFFAYNQHGIQKHICTFIKPTRLKPPKFGSWQGCARFISNRCHLTPLKNNTYPPLQLNGPDKTLYNQCGNLYELALLLECMLLGAGYNAYIISGMVTQVQASAIIEECLPDSKDLRPPETVFKRKVSEQPITIETFFKGNRDRFTEKLEKVNLREVKLLEEVYIEKMAEKRSWKEDIQEKFVGKMATPEGVDLIEKLKQEIKERQLQRRSTQELETLLIQLKQERIKFLQDKRTDVIAEDDIGALEEECKKYLYPPEVEIRSHYAEQIQQKALKKKNEEMKLLKQVGKARKQQKSETKYFNECYSNFQRIRLLPAVLKEEKDYDQRRFTFFDQIREQAGNQAEELNKVYEEEKLGYEKEHGAVANEIYHLYFGPQPKKERTRKVKKSQTTEKKEVPVGDELEQRLLETENAKFSKNLAEEEDINAISEEMSEEESDIYSDKEPLKKAKINKKAVRRLRAKLEKNYLNKRQMQDIPAKIPPQLIEKVKPVNPVIYCWILIKKNNSDIVNDIYLDVATGQTYSTKNKQFLRIDCVWNDKNYYIPIYQHKHIKMTRMFDFNNERLWWHLLCGEPRQYQQLKRSMRDNDDPMIQKHLEAPRTWVGHMKFPKKRFDKIFKDDEMKTFRYKRMRIDVYGYGARCDGIRKRVSEFYNMEQTCLQCIRESFEDRTDHLVYRTRFYGNEKNVDIGNPIKVSEVFEPGRIDQLKCFRQYKYPDSKRIVDMYFYSEFRPDCLKMCSISHKRLKIQFIKGRSDQMTKLKMNYYENAFLDQRFKTSRFYRIVVTTHQIPPYTTKLKEMGLEEDAPIRLEIDLKVGLSYYFFKDEGEKEVKYAMWTFHYNLAEETYIDPKVQPNRVYFLGSSEGRKSTLEREIMLEREQADKRNFLNLAFSTEKEIHNIMKQRRDDENHILIDKSRKSKWSPKVIEKLKIEQLYQIAQRIENKLNTLREKNMLNFFEDLGGGKKIDFVVMQIFKSMAGDEFNLKLAQFINQLFEKYRKAQKKGCPSANILGMVADKSCIFMDAYREDFNKHAQAAEEYYRHYNEYKNLETENLIREHIFGQDLTDNDSMKLNNVLSLFSPKSMELWFDKWFKKQIKKYGAHEIHEMLESVDEILCLREPKNIKPINTSFWKGLGEFKSNHMEEHHAGPASDRSTISSVSAKTNVADKWKKVESTDPETDELCEIVLTNYINNKDETISDDKEEMLPQFKQLIAEKDESNLENVFVNEVKKLVKRYGIMNIKEVLINLGMEKYLYNLQKDVGNIDCNYFEPDEYRKKLEMFKKELLDVRKLTSRMMEGEKNKVEQPLSTTSSTISFSGQVEKALSKYPWDLKPGQLNEDLQIMVADLEKELAKCRLKLYPQPKTVLINLDKPESSTEEILPGWPKTKKVNQQIMNMIPLIKKSMNGKMEINEQKVLKEILYKLIYSEKTDSSPEELQNIFEKILKGEDAWGPGWDSYSDRLKQLIAEAYQQQVIKNALQAYKCQDSCLGKSTTHRNGSKQVDKEITFGEDKLPTSSPRTNYSQFMKRFSEDSIKSSREIKIKKGHLPSMDGLINRKSKLREYKKKRMSSLSLSAEGLDKKNIKNEFYPEFNNSDVSKTWFAEIYWDQRNK